MGDNERRIKFTGYYTPDDDSVFDPNHESGVTSAEWDRANEEHYGFEDIELKAEDD